MKAKCIYEYLDFNTLKPKNKDQIDKDLFL